MAHFRENALKVTSHKSHILKKGGSQPEDKKELPQQLLF
jgi:hypothetical protein